MVFSDKLRHGLTMLFVSFFSRMESVVGKDKDGRTRDVKVFDNFLFPCSTIHSLHSPRSIVLLFKFVLDTLVSHRMDHTQNLKPQKFTHATAIHEFVDENLDPNSTIMGDVAMLEWAPFKPWNDFSGRTNGVWYGLQDRLPNLRHLYYNKTNTFVPRAFLCDLD